MVEEPGGQNSPYIKGQAKSLERIVGEAKSVGWKKKDETGH